MRCSSCSSASRGPSTAEPAPKRHPVVRFSRRVASRLDARGLGCTRRLCTGHAVSGDEASTGRGNAAPGPRLAAGAPDPEPRVSDWEEEPAQPGEWGTSDYDTQAPDITILTDADKVRPYPAFLVSGTTWPTAVSGLQKEPIATACMQSDVLPWLPTAEQIKWLTDDNQCAALLLGCRGASSHDSMRTSSLHVAVQQTICLLHSRGLSVRAIGCHCRYHAQCSALLCRVIQAVLWEQGALCLPEHVREC